jgi:hypothetical protein
MTSQNETVVKSDPASMGSISPMRVCFLPPRDTSWGALVRGLLFSEVYSIAAVVLMLYTVFRIQGPWFYAALLAQLVLHFYMTTEILISNDEIERLTGYGLIRREGVLRFCGYVPRRRRLRTLGFPIRAIEEIGSAAVLVHLYDGTQVQLPKLSLEGQRLFKSVFESMSAGADAEALKKQYASLAPGILVTLEYKESPQLPKWRYWTSIILLVPGLYVGWKLYGLLFR